MSHVLNKSFCILPWVHSFVNSNGAYQVCCTAEEYHDAILKDDSSPFNIMDRPSIEEVMNSQFMKDLRLKLLNGEGSSICTRCIDTEKNGGISRRMLENKQPENQLDVIVGKTSKDGSVPIEIQSIDYRLGNQCNLQCRMCSPFSSDKWISEWNHLMPKSEHIDQTKISYYNGFKWVEGDLLIEEFLSKVQHVKRLHFAGGEPMMSKNMIRLLQKCIELNISSQITISYNTNMTILPQQVLELWQSFKEVRLLCSVDGFDKVNEYIRYPSKWKQVDAHLKFLDENTKKYNISEIMLSTTVQIYNVLNLSELYEYLKKFKNIVPALNLINLTFPHHLSSQVLPKMAKVEATTKLNEIKMSLKDKLSQDYLFLVENIDQVINFMNEKDHLVLLNRFKSYNKNFDLRNKTQLSSSIPDLHKHLMSHYLMRAEQVT